MGNQNTAIQLSKNSKYQEKFKVSELDIYRWRASSSFNKHVCSAILELKSDNINEQICSVGIQQTNLLKNYQIFFQKYVCSFEGIKNCLNLQESIYVFQSLLYGYESIYNKFGKVVIHPKCIFLNQQGQVKVWINPNYYLNELWKNTNKYTDFQKCDINKINIKVPKFAKIKQNQEVILFYSIQSILHKSIQLVKKFTLIRQVQQSFFCQVESYIRQNILKHMNFNKIHQLINNFVYSNRLRKVFCLRTIQIPDEQNNHNKNKEYKQKKINLNHSSILQEWKGNKNNQNNPKTSILNSKVLKISKQLKKTLNISQSNRLNSSLTNDSIMKSSKDQPTIKKISQNFKQKFQDNFLQTNFSQIANQQKFMERSQVLKLNKSIIEQFQSKKIKSTLEEGKYKILPQYALQIQYKNTKENQKKQQSLQKYSILKKSQLRYKHKNNSFSHNDQQNNSPLKKQIKKTTLNLNPTIVQWQKSKESSQIQKKKQKKSFKQNLKIKKRQSEHSLQQAFLNQIKKIRDQIIQQDYQKNQNSVNDSKNKTQKNIFRKKYLDQEEIIISPKNQSNLISRSQFAIQNTKNYGQRQLRVSDGNKYIKIKKGQQSYDSHHEPGIKTIRTLFSGNDTSNICSSIGTMSSEYLNDNAPYSGILTQMGRSVVIKKDDKNLSQLYNTSKNLRTSRDSNKENELLEKLNRSLKL